MRLQTAVSISHLCLIIGHPFQEQVGPDAIIGRGQDQSPGNGKVLIALSPPRGRPLLERELWGYGVCGRGPRMQRAKC